MISDIFFDLDGTLADPQKSIVGSIQFALEHLGRPPIVETGAQQFIGPPLRLAFANILATEDKTVIEHAVSLYRRRFSKKGISEYSIYPGIAELLADLHRKSYRLWVVTAKPKIYADNIVQNMGLDRWMAGVFGSELDGRLDDKSELVAEVIDLLNLVPDRIVMVGDRREDILAGKSNGTLTIAVTYGFGSQKEIIESAPDYICHHPLGIQSVLSQLKTIDRKHRRNSRTEPPKK